MSRLLMSSSIGAARPTLLKSICAVCCALTPVPSSATAATAASRILLLFTFSPEPLVPGRIVTTRSEVDAEAQLEPLDVVAERRVTVARIQRNRIAQSHRAERQQHVCGDTGGGSQLGSAEAEIDELPSGVEELRAVGRVNVADVDKETGTHSCRPAARPCGLQVELCCGEQISAVRIAETVLRAEAAVTADRGRPAGEEALVRGQPRRLAEGVAVAGDAVRAQRPALADRP